MSLRPATLQAIAAFQKRRTRLLLMRGGLFAAAILLALFLLIALLDRMTYMPDALRKALSYGAWLAAIIATLIQTGRLLMQHRDTSQTARLMEKADPALRERLLAAIELANENRGHDSAEFREHLQDQVAAQLTGFNAENILPTKLLTRSIQIVGGVIVLIIALSFFSKLHLPGFIARAALPFANIGRPSSVKIHLLSPEKSKTLVPFSSQTHLAIHIEGPTPARVIVEQQSEGSESTRLEMTDVGENRYESTLHVEQQSVRYRVVAADAITSWMTLDARPRPRATEFIKVITPPAYTKLPAQTLTEDHGDLSALEGSTIHVSFKSNQDLQQVDALLLPAKTPLAISADKGSNDDLHKLELALDGKADSWKLNLTSEETGFTNEEASPWRIDAIKDMPPGVTLASPVTDEQIRADQVIQASGSASDDIGLAKVELSYAVNGADWKNQEIPGAGAGGLEAQVQTSLDLNTISLNTGDALLLKLAATDVKGQRSESNTVRLMIVRDQLDSEQRAWAATQKELATQARSLMTEMRSARKQAEQIKDHAKKDEPEAAAALANLKQQMESVQDQSEQLWKQIKDAAAKAPNALKQQEINLAGQHLARLRDEHLPELKRQSENLNDPKNLRRTTNEATASAETLSEALKAFATADLAQSAHEAFQQLAPQQQQLAERAIDDNRNQEQRPRWQEKQKAALAAAKSARADLEALHEVAPDNRQREIQNQLNNLDQKIPGAENALDNPEQHQAPEFLYGQAHELRNAANQARDMSRWITEEAQNKAAEMRDRLQQRDNQAFAAISEARDHLARAANDKKQTPEEQQKNTEKAVEKLKAAAKQLTSQSELREQNAATNTVAALDQNRLGRALEKLAEQIPDKPTEENSKALREQVNELVENARTLEADAMAQDAQQALEEGQSLIESKAEPQKQHQAAMAAQSQLRPMDKALQRAKADQQAVQSAQRARDQAERQSNEARNQVNNSMNQRQNQQPYDQPQDQHNPTLDANRQAMQQLAAVRESFSPVVNTAREKLEAMTPKLSEMAQQAAEELRETQQATEQAAQQAMNQSVEQNAEATQQGLQPKAAENAQKLESLQAALRQETAHANMADEAQRQMARSADVGLAQMQQQTPQIASNLQQAKDGKDAATQQQALQNAAQSQQQTANALEQMSRNLARMEQGQTLPEDALAAQQAVEEALGIKESLDSSYNDLQSIQELMEQAKNQPQETLAALEQELKKNPAMQKALGNLASKEASDAKAALDQVKTQPQMLPATAPTEAGELARVARHQDRLEQKEAAGKIAEASKQLEQLGKAESTEGNAQAAAAAADQAQQSASAAAKALPTPENPSLFQSVKGAMLAQALDQLDQATHAQSNTDAQQGQQGQQQQQQSAQQSLANASQAQAQSMAQARAQGQVPGQQQPQAGSTAQQTAQNQAQQQGNNTNSSPTDEAKGNWSQTPTNLVVPVTTLAPGGDWGKLPARMAKDLNDAARQEPSPEYRDAIESYYKAIAEKARKQ